MPTVTPIQGPIFVKNGSVPVVPLFSYPTINNGSFIQIPVSVRLIFSDYYLRPLAITVIAHIAIVLYTYNMINRGYD